METQGVAAVHIVEGMIGSDARVLGLLVCPFSLIFRKTGSCYFESMGNP